MHCSTPSAKIGASFYTKLLLNKVSDTNRKTFKHPHYFFIDCGVFPVGANQEFVKKFSKYEYGNLLVNGCKP